MRKVDSLPRVELAYSYPGGTGPRFEGQPAGVAVATNGMTRAESEVFTALRRAGVVVVTVFAYGDNMSAARDPDAPRTEPRAEPRTEPRAEPRAAARGDSTRSDSTRALQPPPAPPMVTAQHLTPAKARILLMVALTRSKDPVEIQRYFLRY
jgi:L-asparaginase/Glu-tRNA(Gln) amidotransferase subunit D